MIKKIKIISLLCILSCMVGGCRIKDKIKFVFVKNYMEIYNDIFGGDNNGRNRKNEND